MLKVTLAHNYYSSATPSGENQVFEAERKLLQDRGHEVTSFTRYSDDIISLGVKGTILGALLTPWNFSIKGKISRHITDHSPDIIHVHNTFPIISPAIFHAVGRRAARVLTLHNYRIACPAAIPMRNAQVCTECIDQKSAIPSIEHGCYRSSRLKTMPLAMNVALHRMIGTWRSQVDAFIALSEFQREIMADYGLPRERIHVKPNFYPGMPVTTAWDMRNDCIVFAGRLSSEKGVLSLVKAWRKWGGAAPELRIVGDGELRTQLEKMAEGLPIRFLGQLPAQRAQAEIANARMLILPSEWFEGFPMVVREAFAFGTPAAVSDIGPLPSIVQHGRTGLVFQPANPDSLLEQVQKAWATPVKLHKLGMNARREFEEKYTEEANYNMMMEIYRQAIEVSRHV